MDLDERLAALGLPDDLPEVGLAGAPRPDAAAAERIRRRVLQAAFADARPHSRRHWPWAVAVALLVLALGLPSGLGWMQGILRIVPGFGVKSPASIGRSLAHPVQVTTPKDTVYVTGLLANSQRSVLTLSMIGPDAASFPSGVRLVDGDGHVYKAQLGSWGFGVGAQTIGGGGYTFPPLRHPTDRLTLVLPLHPTVRVALPLVPAGSLASVRQLPHATARGVTLGASAVSGKGGTLLSLVAEQAPADMQVMGFGNTAQKVRAVTDAGARAQVERIEGIADGPTQLYSVSALPKGTEGLQVVVPEISLRLAKTYAVNVPVPVQGSLRIDKTVQVGPVRVHFTKVQRLSGGRLRVTVSQRGPVQVSSMLGMPFFPSGEGGEARLDKVGGVQQLTFKVPSGVWWVTLQAKDPSLVMLGPWRIDVPLQVVK